MKTPRMLAILLGLLLAAPALAEEEAKEKPEVQEATDKEAKHELMMFEREFDTVDIDFQLQAVKRLGKCIHDDVVDELVKLLYKHPSPHIRAAAAQGLGNQTPFARDIGRKTARLLEDDDLDPKVLAAVVRMLGALEYRRSWEEIADLISHDEDQVVIAVFDVLGAWKELRAWREIEIFWSMYPEEGKWSTGSVTVDTGAAGSADAVAAKKKWQAKYGNKAKQRARPDCVKAMKAAVAAITGEELEKLEAYRDWVDEHKREIKEAERRRD